MSRFYVSPTANAFGVDGAFVVEDEVGVFLGKLIIIQNVCHFAPSYGFDDSDMVSCLLRRGLIIS
jgi:hypothetical protein